MATTLPLVASVCAGFLADRLTVGDAGIACLQVNAIFTLDALERYLDMRLTNTGEQYFGGFRVARDTQGAIFLYNTSQGITHFIQVGFTPGENCHCITGLWEVDWLQCSRHIFAAGEGISGMGVGEFSNRPKVTRRNLRCGILRFSARNNQLSNALIGLRLDIEDMAVGFERAGVDAEIANSAYLSCCSFKYKHRKVVVKGLCIFGYRICCA